MSGLEKRTTDYQEKIKNGEIGRRNSSYSKKHKWKGNHAVGREEWVRRRPSQTSLGRTASTQSNIDLGTTDTMDSRSAGPGSAGPGSTPAPQSDTESCGPEEEDEEDPIHPMFERDVIRSRVSTVVGGIIDACVQTTSTFLLARPFRGNVLTEIVCEELKVGVCALGLFGIDECTKGYLQEDGNLMQKSSLSRAEFEQRNPGLKRPERKPILKSVFEQNCVDYGEEVTRVIEIDTQKDPWDEENEEQGRWYKVHCGLVGKVTHALFFTTPEQNEMFIQE